MTRANIIDGRELATTLRASVAAQVAKLRRRHDIVPGLAVVLVGADPASQVYVQSKERATVEAGMASFDHRLPADTDLATVLALIDRLNRDPAVHGILVQLPLPAGIDSAAVLQAIDPAKDVDGFHDLNAGRLACGRPSVIPCTPLGCLMLMRPHVEGGFAGKRALVIGCSTIVGRPMAQLLLAADCTVTIAHARTRDLATECRRAEILVAAAGCPGLVRGDWVMPDAVVIDVGINRVPRAGGTGTRLVGDVCFDEAVEVACAITPVPGGVGPVTIACLMVNTLAAACRRFGFSPPPEALV